MKVAWVTRSFLDYRVPVYEAFLERVPGDFRLWYNAESVPSGVQDMVTQRLGAQAIGLRGEWRLGRKVVTDQLANRAIRIPWQPGLIEQVRRFQPDVLVGDGFFQWTFPLILLRVWNGIPLVACYERTAHTERHAQWFRRWYRDWVLRRTDALCASGSLCRDYCVQLGYPESRITQGHMVVDVQSLSRDSQELDAAQRARDRLDRDWTGVVVLYVGQLIERKGIQHMMKAWSDFMRQGGVGNTLALVGDGPLRRWIEDGIRAGEFPGVRCLGKIPYQDLPRIYRLADAFIIPTLEDNWSLVVPEAMACGLPVICSKYNGCWPELVGPGDNGWVFDPLSPEETLGVLRDCVARRDDLAAMGARSRERVASHTPGAAAEAILEACRLAMDHRRSAGNRRSVASVG